MKIKNKQDIINFINNNQDIRITDNYTNEQLGFILLEIYKTKKVKNASIVYNMIGYLYMEEYAQPDPSDLAQEHDNELWAVGME